MEGAVIGHKYRNYFELIADPDFDALPRDYGSSITLLGAASYAYINATKANAGRPADAGCEGDGDGIPLADYYAALLSRFTAQSNAVYQQTGRRMGHWDTLMMLIKPLPENCDPFATRDAMYGILADLVTGLDLLEEYGEDFQRNWKQANAPTAEEEHARR